MIKLRLNELLGERGQTLNWLSVQSGVRYATIWSMSKNQISEIRLEALDKICATLECQPGDLLQRVRDTKPKKV
ncbi:MAG: helix-turn-helix domain-containing protein [Blastocatellia bacterium]